MHRKSLIISVHHSLFHHPFISMKHLRTMLTAPVAAALMVIFVYPSTASAGFGGFHGVDIPKEARAELKACQESALSNYGIEAPEETDGRHFGRRHFWGSSDLTSEQRQAMMEEKKACKETIAKKYNLELPDRSARSFGRRGFGGGTFQGVQSLPEDQRTSLLEEIRSLIDRYLNQN